MLAIGSLSRPTSSLLCVVAEASSWFVHDVYRSLRLRVAKTFLKCNAVIAKKCFHRWIVEINPICIYTSRVAERFCGSSADGRAEGLPVVFYRILGSGRRRRKSSFGFTACRLRVTFTSLFKMYRIRWPVERPSLLL